MSKITEWLDCMPQTVQLASYLGRDDYGKPSYGSDVGYRARVVYKTEIILENRMGGARVQTTANGHVWFGPPAANLQSTSPPLPSVQDRITLPDGTSPNILRVDRFPDEDGDHHVKVYFE